MAIYNSCIIDAPINTVWDTIKDFHDLSWGGLEHDKIEKVGDKSGIEVGACRLVHSSIRETMLEFDESEHRIVYTVDGGEGIFSPQTLIGYRGIIRLAPITTSGGTFMEWSANWQSADDGLQEFLDPVFPIFMSKLAKKLC